MVTSEVPIEAVKQFENEGYTVAKGLFSQDEIHALLDHYMRLHDEGGHGYAEGGIDMSSEDPLKRYPRLLQPHRSDARSMEFMIDSRINRWITDLTSGEPLGVQTMVYYKPAGAKGQALHQDQRYLRVEPGTCIAAWLALDDCDEENGCLKIVPGTQNMPMLCLVQADGSRSFTWDSVPVPPGMEVQSLPMKAGDMVFFNGSLIHGSEPNRSEDRFRRIVVGHYLVAEAEKVAQWYHPVYRMDGSIVELGVSGPGGPCGVFRMEDGEAVLDISGNLDEAVGPH